jgi:type IV secretory pathway TraG/TraD family ATPase VirD4
VRKTVNREALEHAIYLLSGSEIELCRLLGDAIDTLLIQPEKNGSNVLSSVLNQLWTQMQSLVNPRIQNITKGCDWTPDDLRQKNATLYVVLTPGQVAEYAPLLRLILGVHLREYLALSEDDAKKRPPILLMFDEMPQLGYMQAIEQAIEMGRSKGIKLWGFLQRLGQLEEQYKDARGFLGNCKAQLYLSPSTEDGTAKMVSDALGTRQDLGGGQQVPLAEPAALAGAEYKDKIVITGQGETPAKVSRDWAYLNDEFQQRMKIPPPNDPKI